MSDQGDPLSRKSVARAESIVHHYGDVTALQNVSVEIPAGSLVGIIGPDGVGKSTFLGLIAGSRSLQQGKLTVLDGNIADHNHRNTIGPRIAYMPQGLGKNLYSDLSVTENLDFFGRLFGQGHKERRRRMAMLTKATGLSDFMDRPAGKLSGGMKQKLGLCCALIHDPDLLILDEPTTGVDPLSRRQFWQLISDIRQQRPRMSVLVSTAYMEEAEQFEWLITMNDGEILACGTPESLMQSTDSDNLEQAFRMLQPGQKNPEPVRIPAFQSKDAPPAIEAKHLTRSFGDFIAVNDVNFEIRSGEIFGFLGSNGCGKTTTMKVLTGLLPASSGQIALWGKPLDGSDGDARERIGFMSQSFSLYSDMTVSQNLALHAKLFHLTRDPQTTRINRLVERFKLGQYLAQLAGELPLGIRQRLSLAVALIHDPEILILDEPTSGVDPAARDEFWRLLAELSRKDGVTIFISTHFMNEALLCDRISLMHAGRVLAQGVPDELIASKQTDNLEDAFVQYMEGAVQQNLPSNTEALASDPENLEPVDTAPAKHPAGFSPNRLLAYSIRETLEILRDPVRLAFAFIGSLSLLVIFTYGISTDVDNIRFASFDLDQSPASRDYLKSFEGSPYFAEQPPVTSEQALHKRLVAGDIEIAIEIPPDFGRELKKGSPQTISVWINGANTFRAGTVEGYTAGAHSDYLARTAQAGAAPLVSFEPRFKYNPTMENIYAMAPSIPAMLLILFPAILMAVSVAREKEIGTITNFYVTPTTRLEFVLGKQLPYIGIGTVNFLILTLFVVFAMGVPVTGSLSALLLGGVLYVTSTTALGFLMSSMVKSQVAAVFVTAVLTMMPTVQFSGMMQPVSTLSDTGRMIGSFWPTTYFMHLSVGSYTKALDFSNLSRDLLALTLFIPCLTALTVFFLRKQEK